MVYGCAGHSASSSFSSTAVVASSSFSSTAVDSRNPVRYLLTTGGTYCSALSLTPPFPVHHCLLRKKLQSRSIVKRGEGWLLSFTGVPAGLTNSSVRLSEANHRRRRRGHICKAEGVAASIEHVELPLFPLSLVLFPGADIRLQIFEYRYRIMMHTLLETDLRFGIVYASRDGTSTIGCVGEVIKHERYPDDRFQLTCRGQERFRILRIIRTRPYIVAAVEWLEDKPPPEPADLDALATQVAQLMKDVMRLSDKYNGKGGREVPEDLINRGFPTPFSFWVASKFEAATAEQQALLELEDTGERLKRESSTLQNTLSYLTAVTAIKDALAPPSD